MDVRTIVLILLRRWYVAVPIALLAIFMTFQSGGGPTYTVESSFLLVTPPDADPGESTNVILDTPSAVNAVANVAAVVMHSEPRLIEIIEAGYSPSYSFTVARNDPFVVLDVTDSDPDVAIESGTMLSQLFVEEMAVQQLRFGADASALVRAELLEISAPDADYSAVRTVQATVLGAGLLLAFLAAFTVEGVVYFFSDRRKEFSEYESRAVDGPRQRAASESASVLRPTADGPAHLRSADADETAPPTRRSRWNRGSDEAGRAATRG